MINYKESFLKNVDFGNSENQITGGYVYTVNGKDEEFSGGSRQRDMTVPVGLVVNDHNDNIKHHTGEYIGVIGIDKINEFLDLNYKPLKRISRKFKSIIKTNITKRNR
jgi:hypothetical protein